MLAAGVTVRLEPMAKQMSAFSEWSKLSSRVTVANKILRVIKAFNIGKSL